MSTFVLVHGAWQESSTWDLVVPKLRRAGHKIITPLLKGLGEDSNSSDQTLERASGQANKA